MKWNGTTTSCSSLRISGIQEDDPCSTDKIVLDTAKEHDIYVEFKDIDRSHCVGNKVDGKSRAILVKFTSYKTTQAFMEKKKDLKDDFYFNEDLTKLRSNLLFKAHKVYKADQLNGAWSYNGKVYVKDAKNGKYEIKSETDIDKLASRKPISRKKDDKDDALKEAVGGADASVVASSHPPSPMVT